MATEDADQQAAWSQRATTGAIAVGAPESEGAAAGRAHRTDEWHIADAAELGWHMFGVIGSP